VQIGLVFFSQKKSNRQKKEKMPEQTLLASEKEVKMEALICEKCFLIHKSDYDGLTCRNLGCQGKLIPIRILYPGNGRQIPLPPPEKPDVAS